MKFLSAKQLLANHCLDSGRVLQPAAKVASSALAAAFSIVISPTEWMSVLGPLDTWQFVGNSELMHSPMRTVVEFERLDRSACFGKSLLAAQRQIL